MPSSRIFLLSLVSLATVLTAGCKQGEQQQQTQASAQAATDAAPDAKPGVAASEGRLVMPTVMGNPAAAYFTLTNSGGGAVTLAAVAIDGAERAEMHETKGGSMEPLASLEVKPGEKVEFVPGGKHVMAFNLKPDLAPGAKVEMTLTFADGDKLSLPLEVAAPGGEQHGHMSPN